jgi:hypothetical protein
MPGLLEHGEGESMSARLAPGTHPAVNQDNEAIEFAVTVDDEEGGRFAISFDTLQDHFGAASKLPGDVLRAFHAGEKRIPFCLATTHTR